MTQDMPRPPEPEQELPAGCRWVAGPDSGAAGDWRLATEEEQRTGRCRRMAGRVMCGAPPVAALYRGRRKHRYLYCADHLYGRWIEGGRILSWRVTCG